MSDAIIVGEGWISEHYFTTEATKQSFQGQVLGRRRTWQSEEEADRATVRSRFLAARQGLEVAIAALVEQVEQPGQSGNGEAAEHVHDEMLKVLGYTGGHGWQLDRTGPLTRLSAPSLDAGAPVAIVRATPVATVDALLAKDGATLAESVTLGEDEEPITSAARLLSTLFVTDGAPDFALVLAGRWALVAERERWAEGRYLAVDIQLVAERNDARRGAEIERALTCLSAESLAPDAEGDIWWHEVLEESVKHTVGVSQDLRDGVRRSIEIIANEVVRRRAAQELAPLPGDEAQPLAQQSLRFLYRILFLLYAEASPELGVLPTGAPEYEQGYSLDRLRELIQVPLATPQARGGKHIYDSLGVLFRLVDTGHEPHRDAAQTAAFGQGLHFNPLRADLFDPVATSHIDEVRLGNSALQEVLGHLLLSKERRGKDRGFISYAELGINQLGAVYEGLMAYTGSFATTDLYEVAKGGDGSKGTWVVPAHDAEGIAEGDFIREEHPVTGEAEPVIYRQGEFVFRLAGRERQQSASYYTPEVLTRFTVSQALAELLDQDGETTPAADILKLTVCEPALGSGAFAIEAVRQLSGEYLRRRQTELGERIDPDDYPRELQKVKAYLALHQTYGVDLNATAVELAEISLWLDTMVAGLDAPWFGLHLKRGNSLVGARRAGYPRGQVADKSWLKTVPRDMPMTSLVTDLDSERIGSDLNGGIHHFLLPAAGWAATADAKEAKQLAPEATKELRAWRRRVTAKPNKKQIAALQELANRVETLWQLAYRRLAIAEQEVRRSIDVWGAGDLPAGGAVQREEIETSLADVNGAYQRLRRVMDAWSALWFWPVTERTVDTSEGSEPITPPDVDQWIAALQALLGRSPESRRTDHGQGTLASATTWEGLGEVEEWDLLFAMAQPVNDVLAWHPWLQVCEEVAEEQGFFHWELDFATVFARDGFDLQVGNPPWVRPRSDVHALLAEGDPWWQLAHKPTQEVIRARREQTLVKPGIHNLVIDGTAEVMALADFLGSMTEYPRLQGLQPDLYRCFMIQTWRHASAMGTIGLIHPESHFTDEKAGLLREETYLRLRRHWQFINELQLFEVHHLVTYGIHIYGTRQDAPHFQMATSLYHPDTVERSFEHDGSGAQPGLKDEDGNWDQRSHRSRLLMVTEEMLGTWHAVLEDDDVPMRRSRMVYTVNQSVAAVLAKLAQAPRIGSLGLEFSRGWDESIDRRDGYFDSEWGAPASWTDVILQGPHLHVATPIYKTPNPTMKHNLDWSTTDFEALAPDTIPVTAYKPRGDRILYNADYTHWGDGDDRRSARDFYRVAWRAMAANTGERTLIPGVIPPGTAHINGVFSAQPADRSNATLLRLTASVSALINDFMLRVAPKSGIYQSSFERLALIPDHSLLPELSLRTLRLNSAVDGYADLWREVFHPAFTADSWTDSRIWKRRAQLGDVTPEWTSDTPLRLAADRRQAIVEIDALVALMLGLSADELCTIYRTQFPVLYGYDRNRDHYDANGRLVDGGVIRTWRKKGDAINVEERTATNEAGNSYTYELPFVTLDREVDMRRAYDVFSQRLAERS